MTVNVKKKQIFELKCHSLASQEYGFVKEQLFLSALICHPIVFTFMVRPVADT